MEKEENNRLDKILKSIGRGEILFTLKCDLFFPHIVYTFFLIFMVLLMNLMIEKTMVRVEENKKEIYDLKIALTHKSTKLIGMEKLSSVQELLEKAGSDLGIPDEPAVYIRE
ncbi:MAG TPA: hypothetical protein IAC09_04935 [Candidatus Cryptobacteroides intestinipullorum]|nr:hypothetical protein [Candidatus Cryptobacteroides intestinipullorum]